MASVKAKDVKGYISRVNTDCEPYGVSHAVIGVKPDGEPIIACSGDARSFNWTPKTTPKTTLCQQCKRRIIN